MSDVFALDSQGQSALEDQARANVLQPGEYHPAFFEHTLGAIGGNFMAGGVKAGTLGPLGFEQQGNAYRASLAAADPDANVLAPLSGPYAQTHTVAALRHDATDYWTPDPQTVGTAGRVLGGLSGMALPLGVGAGDPALLAASQTVDTTQELTAQGVDGQAATTVGGLSGLATLVGAKLPAAYGTKLLTRLATGSAGNLLTNAATTEAQRAVLEHAGQADAAAQFDPLNGTNLTVDAAMGLVFGGIHHAGHREAVPPSEQAALLATANAEHYTQATQPGTPKTPDAEAAHVAAMDQAMRQVLNGEPVNVAGTVDLSQFHVNPSLVPAATHSDYDALRIALESGGNPTAQATGSSALGIDQFTAGTWKRLVAQTAPAWAEGMSEAQVLAARADPAKSAQMERVLRDENAGALSAAGQPVTPLNLYAAHFFGQAKGVAFAKAADEAPVESILTAKQLAANPELAGKTKGEIVAEWKARGRAAGVPMAEAPDAPNFGLAAPKHTPEGDALIAALPEASTHTIDTPERAALREQLVNEHFTDAAPAPTDRAPIVYMMGGGGASGKGTVLHDLQAAGEVPTNVVQVDPDRIKTGGAGVSGIPEYRQLLGHGDARAAAVVHEESSQVARAVMARAMSEKRDFVLDRTLGDPAKAVTEIQALKDAGYQVRLYGVTLDPATAVERAVKRANRTGRFVPIDHLLKAHKGFAQGFEDYAKLADAAVLIDNGGSRRVTLASAQQGELSIHDQAGYNAFAQRRAINEKATTHRSLATLPHRADGRGDHAGDPGAAPGGDRGARPAGTPAGGEAGLPAGDHGTGQAQHAGQVSAKAFPVQGGESTVVTERGLRLPVRWAVVPAKSLITSHDDALRVNPDFPAELQPRDRARAASEAQIARIAGNINPDLLAESPKAADGAPIVGADKVVESGNARTIALRRAYATGKAEAYRSFLTEQAARFGLDPEAVKGVADPVLVRVTEADYNRADFARQANESTVAAMSVTEQAVADAAHLPDLGELHTNDDGTINLRASAKFVHGFIEGVGPNERASMSTAEGQLSQQGQARIRNAVFARAYGDPELVAMMAEATDANVKNVLAGMLRAAPSIARLREMIAEGGRFGPDLAPELTAAVRKFSQLRAEGQTVAQFEAQGDFFGDGGLSPTARELLRTVGENARAPKRMAEFLQRYVDAVDALGDPRQTDLMGGKPSDASGALRTAREATAAANPEAPAPKSGGLFNAAGRPTEAAREPAKASVTAYHASPYRFDAFDASKAGSGIGRSDYGAGVYLTGDAEQGQSYQGRMGANAHLYAVKIPDAGRLFDLTAPLDKQPPAVLKALETEPFYQSLSAKERARLTSQHYYNALTPGSGVMAGDRAKVPAMASEADVSRYLAEHGIVGAQYERQHPKPGGGWKATTEYVIYDPSQIERPQPVLTPDTRAAYEAIAGLPDLKVMDAEGNLRPAAEVLAEGDAALAEADTTTQAIAAAASCFVRTAE